MAGSSTNQTVLYNRGYDFLVELNGHKASFSKVSGIENRGAMEEIQEGGYNRAPQYMRGMVHGEHVLVLEYGATNLNFALDSLSPGRYLPKGVYVREKAKGDKTAPRVFCFEDCYLKQISFGELDASKSSLLINRIEIVYGMMTVSS